MYIRSDYAMPHETLLFEIMCEPEADSQSDIPECDASEQIVPHCINPSLTLQLHTAIPPPPPISLYPIPMASESSPHREAGTNSFSSSSSDFFSDKITESPPQSRSPSPTPNDTLTLRALVSTKDAGVIIGKAGKNVADLREQTGVKAGVSKVIPGVHDRVLTVTGGVEAVAKVCTVYYLFYSLFY